MPLCPSCNQECPINSRFCVQCGAKLPKDSSTYIGIPVSNSADKTLEENGSKANDVDQEKISTLIHNSKQASLKAETLARDALAAANLAKKGQADQLEKGDELANHSKELANIATSVAHNALNLAKQAGDSHLIHDAEDALVSAEEMGNMAQNAIFAVNTARRFASGGASGNKEQNVDLSGSAD